jgi:hypothetical protein
MWRVWLNSSDAQARQHPLGSAMPHSFRTRRCPTQSCRFQTAQPGTAPFAQKGHSFVDRSQPCSERAALAVVSRRIVLFQEPDGKTFSPNGRVLVLGCKGSVAGKSSNIRQVLLKFIFGPAFHLVLQRKGMCATTGHTDAGRSPAREDSAIISHVRTFIDYRAESRSSRSTSISWVKILRSGKARHE